MNGELDDPRDERNTYYRWNPFELRWEYWDKIADMWFVSGYPANVDYKLPDGLIELSFEDTWTDNTIENWGE